MQIILPIIYTLLFIWIIYKWNFFDIPLLPRFNLISFFIIKLLAGFSMWLVYVYYYGSNFDGNSYFIGGEILYKYFLNSPINAFKFFFGLPIDSETTNFSNAIPGWIANFENILFNDSRTMIRINTVIRFFSFGNFHVHTLFMCFISFIGLTALYKSLIEYFKGKQMLLIFAVYFIPTVLYWSSGILKESILVCGIGFLLYSTQLGKQFPSDKKNLSLFIFSLLILFSIKMYVVMLIVPALAANFLYIKFKRKNILFPYLLVYSILFIVIIAVAFLKPDYNFFKLIADKQAKEISQAQGGIFLSSDKYFICIDYSKQDYLEKTPEGKYKMKPGSTYMQWYLDNMQDTTFVNQSTDSSLFSIEYMIAPAKSSFPVQRIKPELLSFVKNIPTAIYNSLLYPAFYSHKSAFELFAKIESMFILLLILFALFFFKKPTDETFSVIIFCLCVSISIFILIGTTTPVMGSLVRYRLPALLFLVIALFLLIDFNKIKNKLLGENPVIDVANV